MITVEATIERRRTLTQLTPQIQTLILTSFALLGCEPPNKSSDPVDETPPSINCPGDVSDNLTAAGKEIYVAGETEIIATFSGGDAHYSSILSLFDPADVEIGQVNVTPSGETVSLGTFNKGAKLIFSLDVPETEEVWYSGPAEENEDNEIHARIVQAESGLWYGGFEDQAFTGDSDFNDVCFTISGDFTFDAEQE